MESLIDSVVVEVLTEKYKIWIFFAVKHKALNFNSELGDIFPQPLPKIAKGGSPLHPLKICCHPLVSWELLTEYKIQ